MDLSIVVPTYNEEENVEKLYQELLPTLVKLKKKFEIIFVDDGSTDRTFEILEKIAKKDPHLKVIKFSRNFGQTAAMLAGFRKSKGNLIVTMDADLQNDPADISRLIEKLGEGYDVVCGWRSKRKDSPGKKISSKFSNWLMGKLMHLDIHDSGCTLRVYRSSAIKDIKIYGETHRYIPAIIASQGCRVGELEVNHRPRKFGKTKYNISRLPKGFLDLLTLKFLTTYESRPGHIFGGIGLVSFLLGFIFGLDLIYSKFIKGQAIANRPLLFLVVLLILMGVQFFFIGLLAELLVKMQKGLKTYRVKKRVNF